MRNSVVFYQLLLYLAQIARDDEVRSAVCTSICRGALCTYICRGALCTSVCRGALCTSIYNRVNLYKRDNHVTESKPIKAWLFVCL